MMEQCERSVYALIASRIFLGVQEAFMMNSVNSVYMCD